LETFKKIETLLVKAGFILRVKCDSKLFLSLMKRDKKSLDGNIKFVLIKDIGKTSNTYVKDGSILKVLKEFNWSKNEKNIHYKRP
jgi:3-dehydroquinate synthetase